ncbi:MAG: tyrosine-type recombinase/integrase [Melioribacter sp.]|nr:tyrosine-type recombinase/integrase [Melioribacter sp.]
MDETSEILKAFSVDDLEKLKILLSLLNGSNQKEIVTLRVFADEYCNFIKQNRSKAYHVSVVYTLKYLTDFFGAQKSIRSIGLRNIENFASHLQQKVNRHTSSSRGEGYRVYFRTLKAAFNKAIEWGYVNENYFLKVKLPKKQKLAPVFISSDQLSAISGQIKNEIVRHVVVFAFYTGMRLDEIINLRWKNIDLGNCVITVGDENFTTKGRKQRFIPICEEAFNAIENVELRMQNEKEKKIISIESLSNARDYVFCKANGERYTGDHISQSFKRACKTAGMDKRIHFHTLRHSFASNLVQKDVSLYTVKELLGHSSISTTEIYSHLNMDSLREAVKKLDETPSCVLPLKKGEKSVVKIFRINSREE